MNVQAFLAALAILLISIYFVDRVLRMVEKHANESGEWTFDKRCALEATCMLVRGTMITIAVVMYTTAVFWVCVYFFGEAETK